MGWNAVSKLVDEFMSVKIGHQISHQIVQYLAYDVLC